MSIDVVALFPTPLFNTYHFPHHHPALSPFKNEQGLIKSIETIAFPGTKFTVQNEVAPTIVQVTTAEYPSDIPLYADRRFLQTVSFHTPEREKSMPSSSAILDFMVSLLGTRYFWGGNWAEGISQMLEFYPHLLNAADQDDVLCKGVDCSGLLYQATNGMTPRNTSELIHYGQEIAVNPISLPPIQPLDMLVWKGHVVFILDQQHTIESLGGKGVIISSLKERFPQILEKTRSKNIAFYLRRWLS